MIHVMRRQIQTANQQYITSPTDAHTACIRLPSSAACCHTVSQVPVPLSSITPSACLKRAKSSRQMAMLTLKVILVVQCHNELPVQIVETNIGIGLFSQTLYRRNGHSLQGKEYPQPKIGVKSSAAGVCETNILNYPLQKLFVSL